MPIVSIICFIIFLVLIYTLTFRDTDVLSPGRLVLIVWSLAIGLANLKLSYLQSEWNFYSWYILLLSIISLLIGIFVVYVININKPIVSINKYRSIFKKEKINRNKLFYITFLLFIIYLISYLVSYLVTGVIPLFTLRPDLVRTTWGIFGFGLFIQTSPTIIYFSLISFYLNKERKTYRYFSLFIFLSTFVTYFFLLQRFNLIFGIILFGIFLYYNTNFLNFKRIIIFSLIIIALLYGISEVRTSKWVVNLLYYISKMKYSVKYAIFTEPYMYVVMNLENFARAVTKVENFTFGYFTFDFIMALSGLKHWLAEYASIDNLPFLNSGFNTYSMFFYYYRDFGPVGAGIIPFIIGFGISNIYYKMRNNLNFNSISLYGLFAFVLMFSFFIPILSWLNFVFNLFIIYFVTRSVNDSKSFNPNLQLA